MFLKSKYESLIPIKAYYFLKLNRSDALHSKTINDSVYAFPIQLQHIVFTPLSHYRGTICQHLMPHTDTTPPAILVSNDSILMRKYQHLNAKPRLGCTVTRMMK